MVTIRRVALGVLLAVATAVLIVAVVEAWNYRQRDYLPSRSPYASEIDERTRALQDRVQMLSRRVADMELLVVVLLGASGLYAMVFVATSYLSATSFARQADRTIANIQNQIGIAMDELRELQEEVCRKVTLSRGFMSTNPGDGGAPSTARPASNAAPAPAGNLKEQIDDITLRIAAWRGISGDAKLELLHYENAAAYLEVAGGRAVAASMAGLYRALATSYNASDQTKARFYFNRALSHASPESQMAAEIHYDLACWYARAGYFELAMENLTAAFERHLKMLDARLSADIEEGGKLYELASTPPFDKAVNDLLLNVSIT